MDSLEQSLPTEDSEASLAPVSNGVVSHQPLTDGQLLVETLLVTDVTELEGALSERPPVGAEARLIKYYKLPKNQETRCCFCKQRQKHQVGYLCTFGTADRYLVGNICGNEVLGNGFKLSARRIQEDIARQASLGRLVAIETRSGKLLDWCQRVLFGDGLREIEVAAREIQDASQDLFIRLKASALSGEMMSVSEQVRDVARELKLDNRTSSEPIFKTEQKDVGVLAGVGLFKASEMRTEIYALKRELTNLSTSLQSLRRGPLSSRTNLRKQLKALTNSYDNARKAASDIATASRFYSEANFRLVALVFGRQGQLQLNVTAQGLRVEVPNKSAHIIRNQKFTSLPPIPPL